MHPTTSCSGIQHLGNTASGRRDAHDLMRVTVHCRIGEILRAGYGVRFDPDTLEEAHRAGYGNCALCIGGVLPRRWE